MADAGKNKATYSDLYDLPENMTGEIIDGELIATLRPSRQHVFTTTALGTRVASSFQFGEGGGPGGWIILIEPEIKLAEDVLVPDLVGWKEERFPFVEEHNSISAPPDWVCEVLSPSTLSIDKIKKMPVYARHAIRYLWLVDPIARTLDAFRLESGKWLLLDSFSENDKLCAEPFGEVEIDLGKLWLEPKSKDGSIG